MTASRAVLADVRKAIATGSITDRGGLTRHVTDLFLVNAAGLADDEIALFDDVLTALVREIDTAARALLALRLAPVANAPARLMSTLARDDEPDVACPVLAQSARLDDPTLTTVARLKSHEHLFAISQRQSLSAAVTDVLVERGDAQVLLNVAGNAGARFSLRGFERLVERAEGDDALAERVGRRKDIPPRLFERLVEVASEQVRARLAAEMPHTAREVRQAVESAAAHVVARHQGEARDLEAVRASVEQLHQRKQLDDEQVRSFAEDGLVEEVRIALSLLSGLPTPFVDQALQQEGGETLVVMARATGLSWSTVKSILRLPIWRRPATESEIRQCLARYEKLSRATASDIMRFYKTRL
jgi:uncharacterized protein (DUF2336 family)